MNTLGDFSEETWEGVSKLPNYPYLKNIVHDKSYCLESVFKFRFVNELREGGLDEFGIDLLRKMFIYDPKKRITA